MKKVLVSSIILLFLGLAFALAVPQIPHTFAGNVIYTEDTEMDLSIYDLSAEINGIPLGVVGEIGVEGFNFYTAKIDASLKKGGEIVFFIGGTQAQPTFIYTPVTHTETDLTITEFPSNAACGNGIQEAPEQCDGEDLGFATCDLYGQLFKGEIGWTGDLGCTDECFYDISECKEPFCGDNICSNTETCSSCATDCGSCSSGGGSSGGGGGGGSGGGSGGGGGGGGTSPPSNTAELSVPVVDTAGLNEEAKPQEETVAEEEKSFFGKFFSFITGAAIGNSGTSGWVFATAFILVVVATLGFVRFKKSVNKN